MIPTGSTVRNLELQEIQRPSLTWKLDFKEGKVTGKINGVDSIKQSVNHILKIQRYNYLIYSFNYGNEFKTLIGKDPLLVRSELKRMINESLLQDDRIIAIQNINIEVVGDTATATFTVVTQLGTFDVETEVL